MPNYVTKELNRFQYPNQQRAQYTLHQWTGQNYGDTNQLANPLDNLLPIPQERKCRIQQIVVTFLYYERVVDCTMLTDLNLIAEQQAHQNHNIEDTITHILDYAATNPTALVKLRACDIVLHIDSDSS